MYAYDLITWKTEARGLSCVHSQSGLHSKYEASQGYSKTLTQNPNKEINGVIQAYVGIYIRSQLTNKCFYSDVMGLTRLIKKFIVLK